MDYEACWQPESPEYMGWLTTAFLKHHLMKGKTTRVFDHHNLEYLQGARDICAAKGAHATTEKEAAKNLTALINAIEKHHTVRVSLKGA